MRRLFSRFTARGQGTVEFALALPIFLLLTFGVIEMGWLVFSNHTLTNATREGARYAMVNGERSDTPATEESVEQVVQERSGALPGDVTVTDLDFESPDMEPGTSVTVKTSYDYQPIVGVMVGISPFALTSESTVIVQY